MIRAVDLSEDVRQRTRLRPETVCGQLWGVEHSGSVRPGSAPFSRLQSNRQPRSPHRAFLPAKPPTKTTSINKPNKEFKTSENISVLN